MPTRIGIVTSPDGAVLHDILNVAGRRFPNTAFDIVPVKVQGDGASGQIAAAIELLNRRRKVRVVIVARGGGSLEDMAAFNSEIVARAVFGSAIPVVSAVGHETDYTICDFVRRLPRAPTPSAAAELVLPLKTDLVQKTADLNYRLQQAFDSRVKTLRRELNDFGRRIVHPSKRLQDSRLRIDDLTVRLTNVLTSGLKQRRERWDLGDGSDWRPTIPGLESAKYKRTIETIEYNLLKNIKIKIDSQKNKYTSLQVQLQALSPSAVLERGYSITRTFPGGKHRTRFGNRERPSGTRNFTEPGDAVVPG